MQACRQFSTPSGGRYILKLKLGRFVGRAQAQIDDKDLDLKFRGRILNRTYQASQRCVS
nr:MAG TPA: hypothetical protein [Bacteriophage sp.]